MQPALRIFAATFRHLVDKPPTSQWEAYKAWLIESELASWLPTDEEMRSLDAAGFVPQKGAQRTIPILAALQLGQRDRSNDSGSSFHHVVPEERLKPLAQLLARVEAETLSPDAMVEAAEEILDGVPWPDGTGTVPYVVGARVEAALAIGLLGAKAGNRQLLLVGGDISGIQGFLYTISSKGALKSLRARSLALELLARSLAADVADIGGGPMSEIYVGGGRFYCILPDRPDVHDYLDELRRRRAGSLFREFRGRLGFSLAAVRFTPEEAWTDATALWGRIQGELNDQKRLLFQDQLKDPRFWEPQEVPEECEICRQPADGLAQLAEPEPGEEPVLACAHCRDFFRLGGQLPRITGFAEGADSGFQLGGRRFQGLLGSPHSAPANMRRIWILPGPPLPPGSNVRRLSVPICIATGGDGQVLTVEELASLSTGDKLIGAVRMDADNLGRLFSEGLPAGMRTVAHVASLSFALESFFSDRVAEILSAEGRHITLVYGGGDDAFWLGPWDQVVESVFDVQQAFSEATGGNPSVTLSAGVVAANPHTPLYRLAAMAGAGEDAAKDLGRNRVALFRGGPAVPPGGRHHQERHARAGPPEDPAVLTWDMAHWMRREILDVLLEHFAERCSHSKSWRPVGGFSRSMIHRLAFLSQSYLRTGRMPFAQLVWVLARWGERLKQEDGRKRAWQELSHRLCRSDVFGCLIPFLTWLDLLLRGEEHR